MTGIGLGPFSQLFYNKLQVYIVNVVNIWHAARSIDLDVQKFQNYRSSITMPLVRHMYERYGVHTSQLRDRAITMYVWLISSMSYVSTTHVLCCFRMCYVCVTYVRRIGPATYVLRISKCTHKK